MPDKTHSEFFSSRLALIISVLGIAVGTGNIWRFPRIVAQNDGGTFLIPWVIFLLIWSVPLIMAEFAMGKHTRMGNVGAFAKLIGEKFGWMGAFVGFVATAIMFYYSVVAGWCIYYFTQTITQPLPNNVDTAHTIWNSFQGSSLPVLFHLFAMGFGGLIIYRGVTRGIERVSMIMVPTLLIIIVIAAVRAVTLDGAAEGFKYFFTPNLSNLGNVDIWLAALTQNAWDTGAGWGLIMTYAIYMRKKEDIGINSALIGFGNNSVSLLAGITIFCTVFALLGPSATEVLKQSGPASTGLTFIWMPQLFNQMPGGSVLAPLFFLGLSFAAFTSLISMIELAVRIFIDAGLTRRNAILIVSSVGFLAGIPSALNLGFFANQDWVWGVGLMISGAFISFAILKFGVEKFRRELINGEGSDAHVGKWWSVVISVIVPLEVIILLVWWLYNSTTWYPETWWQPFNLETPETLGTCIFQWTVLIIVLLGINKWLVRRTLQNDKKVL